MSLKLAESTPSHRPGGDSCPHEAPVQDWPPQPQRPGLARRRAARGQPRLLCAGGARHGAGWRRASRRKGRHCGWNSGSAHVTMRTGHWEQRGHFGPDLGSLIREPLCCTRGRFSEVCGGSFLHVPRNRGGGGGGGHGRAARLPREEQSQSTPCIGAWRNVQGLSKGFQRFPLYVNF